MEQYRLFSVHEVQRLQRQITELLSFISMSRGKPRDETAWLIEWPATEDSQVRWWHPLRGWTIDASRASRFARQEDAEAFIATRQFVGGVIATEHKWVSMAVGASAALSTPEQLAETARFMDDNAL